MALTTLALAGALALPWPAAAQAPPGDTDPPGLDCVGGTTGTIGAAPTEIVAGQEATLSWTVQAPAGCAGVRVQIEGIPVDHAGSMSVSGIDRSSAIEDPIYDGAALVAPGRLVTRYALVALIGSVRRTLGTIAVAARLPVDATGRPEVTIGANHHTALFVLAIRSRSARISVRPEVELDLSAHAPIYIADGVRVSGGRTSRIPGARLYVRCTAFHMELPVYCSSSPNSFLVPAGNDIRISGLRIEGTDMSVAPEVAPVSHGIVNHGWLNVEIDHNEISGWRGSGVLLNGQVPWLGLPEPDPAPMRIHDNVIHHNQHDGRDGYGVSVTHGGYALIERNVFDYNRHAIMGDGEYRTRYRAYRNLVLENGGEHEHQAGMTFYTHQFDMHGTDDCDAFLWIDGHHNCGRAGEFMDIRYNSFFYTNGHAFKLRGHPTQGVTVVSNVFAHLFLTEGPTETALAGYLDEITAADNLVAVNEGSHHGDCDFDGDGLDDDFLATGQTWWFRSPGRQWNYLNTSRARWSDLTLGDVTHDGICDVTVDGVVVSGGRGWARPQTANVVWKASTGSLTLWEMDGGTVADQTAPGTIQPSWRLAGLGNLSGDGSTDLVWRDDAGKPWLWDMVDGWRVGEQAVRSFGALQGVGDFDGDGVDDLLWRDAAGQLAISFGLQGDRSLGSSTGVPTLVGGPGGVAEPVDPAWVVRGVGDFDGDARADILVGDARGSIGIAYMIGTRWVATRTAAALPRAEIQAVTDFDNDGRADVLWREGSRLTIWFGGESERAATLGTYAGVVLGDATWTIVDARDFNRDGRADLLWQDATTGRLVLWILDGGGFVREEYPRLPLRTWTLASRLAALREAAPRTPAGGETDDLPPTDCGPTRCR